MSTAPSVTLNNSSDTSASAATLSSAAASVTSSASKLSENSKKEQATSAANKQKFSALNINNLYKGKSLENPKASVVVPKHGLQTVGKVGAGRRVPPPANIPSLKSSSSASSLTSNTNTTANSNSNTGSNLVNSIVNIVPSGGQGWAASGKDDPESLTNKVENSTCPSTADSVSTASSTSNDFLAPIPPPTTGVSSRSSSQGGPIHHSGSSERLAPPMRQPNTERRQADPYFAQEFPQLSSTTGGNSSQPQSAKDLSNARQGSRGGPHHGEGNHRHNNLSYNYKDTGPNGAEEDISLLATNLSSLDGQNESFVNRPSRNTNNKISTSISSNPNFLLPDPPISSATNVPISSNPLSNQQRNNYNLTNSQQQFSSSSQSSNQYERNSSNHYRSKQKADKRYMPTIISDKELKSLDQMLNESECTWALEAEIDYNAKLDFSDSSSEDESEEKQKKSTSSLNNNISNKPVIDSFNKKSLNADRPGKDSFNPEVGQFRDALPDDSHGPKVQTLAPSAPFRQDPNRTSYVGRKSDSVYEFNRKDQEYDGRREYYRESHRSQQLSRGGGARDAYSANTYQQAPTQTAPMPGSVSVQQPPASQSSTSSSRTSTLDRERSGGVNATAGPRSEGVKKGELDENWRPKRMQDDISSAVMRGRQMREDEDDDESIESAKKPMGPAGGADELILPSKNMPPQKDIRASEDLRSYDRRRDESGYSNRGERERDRYAPKNQYATNLPPRLQRQAEMQYREQSQRGAGPRGQPMDNRYDDPRMRNVDRGDDLFEPRRSDRRTPEDAGGRSTNVRTETGSWRNSNASQRKIEERRDSQIESDSLNPPSQSVELKNSKDGEDSAASRKTSYDSNSSKVAENFACDSARKLSTADSTPPAALASVAASQPDLNKLPTNKPDPQDISSITTIQPKEISPPINKVTERSELVVDSIDTKPKDPIDPSNATSKLSEVDSTQRARSNATEPQLNRANNYDQSKRSADRSRDSGRALPAAGYQPVTSGTNNRSDVRRYSQQPLLSHSENGRDYHRQDQRNASQPQQPQSRRDNQRNAPQPQLFEPSNRPPLLGSVPKSLQTQSQHYEPKVLDVETKKIPSSFENQRQTTPQSVAAPQLAPVQTNVPQNSQTVQQVPNVPLQQQASSAVMYPPTAPTAGATNIRAVRTAYGPPASKAAFGGGEIVQNKQPSPPAPSATPPQQSMQPQDNLRTQESKAPLLTLPSNQKGQSQLQQSGPRSNEQGGQRGGRGRSDSNRQLNQGGRSDRSDVRENRDGRYRNERRNDRDRKLSTSSKNSAVSTLTSAPAVSSSNSAFNLNNNQKAESDDVNNDEWETASDNSDNLDTSHGALDRNANITTSTSGTTLSSGGQSRRNQPQKVSNNNNDRESRSLKSGQESRTFRGDEHRGDRREPRGRRERERRNEQIEPSGSNYRAPRGERPPGRAGERERGPGDANRGRSGSYRAANLNAPLAPKAALVQPSSAVSRNQDVIVNAMSKITLDDAKLAQNALLDSTKVKQQQQQPIRKNSTNAASFNHISGDYVSDDLYLEGEFDEYNQSNIGGKNAARRGRTSSNASANNNKPSKRKERSKSKGRGRGSRESRDGAIGGGRTSGGSSNQVTNTKGLSDFSSKSQTVSSAVSCNSIDSKSQAKSDTRPVNPTNSNGRNQNNSRQQGNNSVAQSNRNSVNSDPKTASSVISQQPLPPAAGSVGSSHPSTSSTKSNSFDQHDSGIESGDQPPSTSSTSTSLRSSPSTDDNKVVSSTANNLSKVTTTTNASSVKCSTTTTSTADSKVKSKTDSLIITKIPDMDSSTTNINNRKIVGTLIYENTKLKEENKVLSKIDEGVDSATLPKPAIPHPSSSVAEELNLKFASVKKVWENPLVNDSTERKNSLLTSSNSPVEKNFADKNKSTVSIGGGQASTGPITSPPPIMTANYQANVQYGGQNTSAFHQNVVQTPTSPPTALAPIYSANPLAPNQAAGPFQFGPAQMEPTMTGQMGPFVAPNPHQNPMHSVIPHAYMSVQPGGTGQQNVTPFGQHVINPAAAAAFVNQHQANQASLQFMAQLAHQSQQHMDHMNKFSLNQTNLLANNILKSQQFVGAQPNQAVSGGHHANAAALHQAQQQGTANWAAASQAASGQGQQPPPHPYVNPMPHFVQTAPGQPSQQQSQPFNRQQNPTMVRNAIDQSQTQTHNALRSFIQAGMLNDAMQNQLNHAQFMHHNQHHGHHHHDPSRQAHAAATLQQASRQAAGQAAFQPNAMNQSWPNMQQQLLLKSAMGIQSRQLMQMFNNATGQPLAAMGGNVSMGMPVGGGANNHRTSPSGSVSMGNSYPAPIQRPNNGSGGNQSGKNGPQQYNSNRNGTGGKSQYGSSKGGNRNNYYHNNRNSSTPSPSGKSTSISSDLNGAGSVANNLAPNAISVECNANVNKE